MLVIIYGIDDVIFDQKVSGGQTVNVEFFWKFLENIFPKLFTFCCGCSTTYAAWWGVLPLGKTCETLCDMMGVANTGTAVLISSSLRSVPKDEETTLRRVLGVMWAVGWPIMDINKNWSTDVICQLPGIANKVHHMAGNCIEGMVVSNEITFFSCTTHLAPLFA